MTQRIVWTHWVGDFQRMHVAVTFALMVKWAKDHKGNPALRDHAAIVQQYVLVLEMLDKHK